MSGHGRDSTVGPWQSGQSEEWSGAAPGSYRRGPEDTILEVAVAGESGPLRPDRVLLEYELEPTQSHMPLHSANL
jgi:hypothetical protein